jgi:hypothetical protein
MGSKGPGGPTLAQNLEAPRTLSMAAQPDVSSLDQPSAKDMKMGRRRQPPWARRPPAPARCQIRRARGGRIVIVIRASQARRRPPATAEEEPPRSTAACPPAPPGRGLRRVEEGLPPPAPRALPDGGDGGKEGEEGEEGARAARVCRP